LSRAYEPLTGNVAVPGDKSVSHRAALFGLIASGPCRAAWWLDCDDTRASLAAVQTLGATVSFASDVLKISPPVSPPTEHVTIDCGNSGTTARLLTGILAGWLSAGSAGVVLQGDASLSRRPMGRVVEPLRAMGADIDWLDEPGRLPIRIRGAKLKGVDHHLEVASAQVKSALLLAGLFAEGNTTVTGADGSRDHTELLLKTMGGLDNPGRFDIRVPGDPSSAAFFQVAAAMVPGSEVTVNRQSINYTRTGALRVLRRAGAKVTIERPSGEPGGEPLANVKVAHNSLKSFTITAGYMPALIDEIPVLAVLATQAEGETVITGAAELRVKESDRLAVMAENLKLLGAKVVELKDGLKITGPTPLIGGESGQPVKLKTAGDHRVAMAMAVAALVTKGETVLDDDACVAVSYPYFFQTLEKLL
jgi:3-phosphoshikimate 1-carboxyvinyltransferase